MGYPMFIKHNIAFAVVLNVCCVYRAPLLAILLALASNIPVEAGPADLTMAVKSAKKSTRRRGFRVSDKPRVHHDR